MCGTCMKADTCWPGRVQAEKSLIAAPFACRRGGALNVNDRRGSTRSACRWCRSIATCGRNSSAVSEATAAVRLHGRVTIAEAEQHGLPTPSYQRIRDNCSPFEPALLRFRSKAAVLRWRTEILEFAKALMQHVK